MNDPQPQPTNHQRLLEKAMAHNPHGTGASALPVAPSLAELASDFPDYEIIELIGRGGMGAVYKAVQRNLQRTVAIKVLPKELASDPEFGERFLREAQTLATLNHPGIITVYDYGDRNGVFFLVTEFVDGVNLRQLMELGELSPAEALRIAPQLCTALQFAHERGVVHRDIKPENILIDTNGQVKVADFGLAKVARPGDAVELTRNTAVLGTPHYMAPEQWNGARQVDHRADIYSLGVVLYEMLTGNLPLGNFDMPSERGGVPQGLDAVVRRALAQQPKNRYQHARDVQSDVERQAEQLSAQQQQQQSTQPSGQQQPSRSTDTRNNTSMVKGPLIAIASVLLTVITLGFLTFVRQSEYRQNHRFESKLEAYRETAKQAIAQRQNGQEVTEVLSMPAAPPAPMVPAEALPVIAVSLAGGALLLMLALGFGSIRTIRNSNGRKSGLGLAVFTAWVAPLTGAGALACSPLNAIRSNDLQVMLGIAVIAGAVYSAVRFLIWETARQRKLIDAGIPAHHGKAWITAALTLGLGAFANAVASPRYLATDARHPDEIVGATFGVDLIGRSHKEVVALIGPPVNIVIDDNGATWAYWNEFEKLVPAAVRFKHGRVTKVDQQSTVLRGNPTGTQPRIGTAIEVIANKYGRPIDVQQQGNKTHYRFASGHTAVEHEGIVIEVRAPDTQAQATSPVAGKNLLGKTRNEVIKLLGPPLDISISQAAESWSYRNGNGVNIDSALVFSGAHVIAIDEGSEAFLPNRADMTLPQLGQSMNEFIKRYGSPASRTDGQLASTFTFDNGVIVKVRDGVVVGVEGK